MFCPSSGLLLLLSRPNKRIEPLQWGAATTAEPKKEQHKIVQLQAEPASPRVLPRRVVEAADATATMMTAAGVDEMVAGVDVDVEGGIMIR